MKKTYLKHFVLLLLITYATMTLFGVIENIKGVAFPLIKDTFGAQYDAQGGLISSSWFGYVFFCMVATLSIQRFGAKFSLLGGYVMIGIGCVLILFAPSFTLVSMALMVLWMGFGFFEVGGNALATTTFTQHTAIYMNLMHFFYGFGAVMGPLFATSIVKRLGSDYRGIYLVTLIPVIIVALLLLATPSSSTRTEEDASGQMGIKDALKNKYVWLFSISLGFLEVIEFGVANWGAFFLYDAYQLDPLTAGAAFVSGYYVFFTLSRLVSGFAIEKIGYVRSIVLGLLALFILYLFGFILGTKGIFLLVLTGFFVGIMWPTLMCVVMTVFGNNTAIASSVIIVLSGTINGIIQLATGFINEYISNTLGYKLNMVYIFIPLFLLIFIHKSTKKTTPVSH